MNPAQRVVTKLPLTELWDASGPVPLTPRRLVGIDEVIDLLRGKQIRFVVANCGVPLQWIPKDDCHRFWKEIVKSRLVEPKLAESGFRLEDFPGEYCFCATEWIGTEHETVVVLEQHH